MLGRITVIALNTYREAVRARILHGLFGLALATGAYSLVVGSFALRSSLRVTSDLGAASISIYGIVVAVVLTATTLHRELEHKTIFPVLARPIRRSEYLWGKYLGTLLTVLAFVAANSAALLFALAQFSGRPTSVVGGFALGVTAVALGLGAVFGRARTYLPLPWALVALGIGWQLANNAPDNRRVVLGAAVLCVCEVAIIVALATVFASFSSPFLTALFTFGVFLVGRSADTLAKLPENVFGKSLHDAGAQLSRVFPNLMFYVPPRPLLTGESFDTPLGQYLARSALHAGAWALGLMIVASVLFRRRDFL